MTRSLRKNTIILFSTIENNLLKSKLFPLHLFTLLIVILSLTPTAVSAGEYSVFGPSIYIRSNGAPIFETDTILSTPSSSYLLKIQNGGLTDDGEYERVTSSHITLNDEIILSPNELNQNVEYIEKTVTLTHINELAVKVRGKPGGALIIYIEGIDNSAPNITANVSPLPNASGWHDSDVTVTFTCFDDLSGISTCPDPVTVSTEGANQVVTGEAIDIAGNIASTSITLNIDKTAPTVSIISPLNGAILTSTAIAVSGQVTDQHSSLSVSLNGVIVNILSDGTFTQNLSLVEGNNSISLIASDTAGNITEQTISVLVQLNQPPIVMPSFLSVNEDALVNFILNASDPDGDILNYAIISQPSNGAITGIAPNLIYSPNSDFHGVDSLSFIVNDGLLDSEIGVVTFEVNSINDVPQANDLTFQLNEESSKSFILSAIDPDGDNLTFEVLIQPSNGVITGNVPNLVYTPNTDFNGLDSLSYKVNDGFIDSETATVNFNIAAVNDAPIAQSQSITINEDNAAEIILSAIDPDSPILIYSVTIYPTEGVLTGDTPNLTYTPVSNFNGTDEFTFSVTDGEFSHSQSISILVNSVNDAPISNNVDVSTSFNTAVTFILDGTDIDSESLTINVVSQPNNGQLSNNGSTFEYIPESTFFGEDSFQYSVNDGSLSSNISTVTIVVEAPASPIINSDPVLIGYINANYTYEVDAADPNGLALNYALSNAPVGMEIDSLGVISWTPSDEGEYLVVLTVTNSVNETIQQSYSIKVINLEPSHEGDDFWLVFSKNHTRTSPLNGKLFLSSKFTTQGTITVPALDFTMPFSVTPGTTTTIDLKTELLNQINASLTSIHSVHVTSDRYMSVYALNQIAFTTDGFLVHPTNSLGLEYTAIGYTRGQIAILALENNTHIKVKHPTDYILGFHGDVIIPSTEIQNFTLNKGEVKNLIYYLGISNSTSISGINILSDKPVAVFSGHSCVNIPDSFGACDHLVEQIPPTDQLGLTYASVPLATRLKGDTFRVVASFDDTQVSINNNLEIFLNKGEWWEDTLKESTIFLSNHPVTIAQFSNGFSFDGVVNTDPFMMLLTAEEQFLSQYTFATPEAEINSNFVNIIIRSDGISTLEIDGVLVDASLFSQISSSGLWGAQVPVSIGSHTIVSDEKFGLSIYGFDAYDSYGYQGGQRLTRLSSSAVLTVTQNVSTPELGSDLCFSAYISDNSLPVVGARVDFSTNGVSENYDHIFTDSEGMAVFCYQSNEIGLDIIEINSRQLATTASVTWQWNFDGVGTSTPVIISTFIPDAFVSQLYHYQVEALDADVGDELIYSLVTAPLGMTITNLGLIQWSPNDTQKGIHDVNVLVTDSTGNSNSQVDSIRVSKKNSAPVFINPPESIVGYIKNWNSLVLSAVDADGDQIYYESSHPELINIGYITGAANWNPAENELGEYLVTFTASDRKGGVASIQIPASVIQNYLPVLVQEPAYQAKASVPYSSYLQMTDPNGDSLTYNKASSSTNGLTVDANTGLISWTPTEAQIGTHTVKVTVHDIIGLVYYTFTITVYPDDQPLESQVTITPDIILQGDEIAVTVDSTGALGNVDYTLSIKGENQELTNRVATYSDTNSIGSYEVIVTADDGVDYSENTFYFSVSDGSDQIAPNVEIIAPVDGDRITSITGVVATIEDEGLEQYTLRLVEVGKPENNWIIAQGHTPVIDSSIHELDPSLLINGQYHLILAATDASGNESIASSTIIIEGDLKVGNFTYTVNDFTIPMSGIPISINRTYDSRRKHEFLDFGYGWSLSYQNTKLEESRPIGSGWSLNEYKSGTLQEIVDFCVEPQGAPIISVTLPDGGVETFEVKANPQCNRYLPIIDVVTEFNPIGDTQSTLSLQSSAVVRLVGNQLEILGSSTPYNPDKYILTTRTGFQYYIDQQLGVEKIIDPNSNTITFSDNGIVHSDGTNIEFTRLSNGQISTIKDTKNNRYSYNYSSRSDLIEVQSPSGKLGAYDYNYRHGLTNIEDADGHPILKNIYDDAGRLVAQENAEGLQTNFNHDIAGQQSLITDKLGNLTLYYYDDKGNVTSIVDALGGVTSFTYDGNGNQLTNTDANNNTTSATYNTKNDQLTQTDALNHTTIFTYNQRGQELTIKDAKGNEFTNTYDSVGNLLTITDPLGNISGQNIDVKGRPELVRNTLNFDTLYTYDETGNKLSETNALGHVMEWTYDSNGNVLTELVQRTVNGVLENNETQNAYDTRNNLISVRDAAGKFSTAKFNLNGLKTEDRTVMGFKTNYVYDVYGRLVTTHYTNNSSESSSYDDEGNLISETDRNGYTTVFLYDALNRLLKTTFQEGSNIQSEYDAVGNIIAEINELGNRTIYEYDAANRRTLSRDALGNETKLSYDENDNVISQTDANNNIIQYEYDELDRKVKTIYSDSSFTESAYDALGQITRKTDQNGMITSFYYDALGRLDRVIDASGNETRYSYDEIGNKITQTDAKTQITAWRYDVNGYEIERALPLGQIESKQYDDDQKLVSLTDFNGQVTTLLKSATGRIERENFNGIKSQAYEHDDNDNRTDTRGSYGSENWVYDSRNRLISNTKANGDLIEYEYDLASNRTQLTITPNNETSSTTTFTYDALNRLAGVTDDNSQTTTYTYDAVGNRESISYPNGNTTSYEYDSLNRLIRQSTTDSNDDLILDYQYTLGASGHRTQIIELNGRTTDYIYDDLYRLTEETITDVINGDYTASYQYDEVGNRTQSIINGVTTAYTYDDNDRLIQKGGETYSYDDQGNTLSKTIDGETSTYTYDEKNQLDSASLLNSGSTVNTTYQYDIDGIRISKTEDANTIDYLIDHNRNYAQVLKETDKNTTISTDYLYGDDLINQSQNSTNELYYLYDGLGSTRILTDQTSSITDTYDYESFGTTLNQTGTSQNNYLFTGEQYDSTLEQQYLRARYYDPAIGRFTQQDTWMGSSSDPQTLHKYLYVDADPVNNIDPTGHFTLVSQATAQKINTILTTTSTAAINTGFTFVTNVAGQVTGIAATTCVASIAATRFGLIMPIAEFSDKCDGGSHRGRFQAQGGDVEESVDWSQGYPPSVKKGLYLLRILELKLSKNALRERYEALEMAKLYVKRVGLVGGAYAPESLRWPHKNAHIRIDLEIFTGRAFVRK